jgi:hypothetical protein
MILYCQEYCASFLRVLLCYVAALSAIEILLERLHDINGSMSSSAQKLYAQTQTLTVKAKSVRVIVYCVLL